MATETIGREEVEGRLEFVLRRDGKRAGSLEYTRPDDRILRIEYVEVEPELRGGGVGRQLVAAAVSWAKELNLQVVPICSYARMVIERDPALR
jgi:predicted GNAT family acetyltransferase